MVATEVTQNQQLPKTCQLNLVIMEILQATLLKLRIPNRVTSKAIWPWHLAQQLNLSHFKMKEVIPGRSIYQLPTQLPGLLATHINTMARFLTAANRQLLRTLVSKQLHPTILLIPGYTRTHIRMNLTVSQNLHLLATS
jgi:hypothetical protein